MSNSSFEIIKISALKQPAKWEGNNTRTFYSCSLDLKKFHSSMTISPMTYRISNTRNRSGDDANDIIEAMKARKDPTGYQRYLNNSRIDSIASYLESYGTSMKKGYGHLIPNSIIVSLQAKEVETFDEIDLKIDKIFYVKQESAIYFSKDFLSSNDRAGKNEREERLLIIDGNHRVQGIKQFLDNNPEIEAFDVLVSLILNFTNQDSAELFKTINYKVKAVNKSYYYQIVGEFEIGEEEHIFLHSFIDAMNKTEHSPFHHRVKMLGSSYSTPSGRKQSFSQSFFIEQCYEWLFSFKQRVKIPESYEVYRMPVLHSIYEDSKEKCTRILSRYFYDIKIQFESAYGQGTWDEMFDRPESYNRNKNRNTSRYIETNYLMKNLGLGAFINLFPLIFMNYLYDEKLIDRQHMIDDKNISFQKYLKPFFNLREFNIMDHIEEWNPSGGGQGLLRTLANRLLAEYIRYGDDLADAEAEYHVWYRDYVEQVIEREKQEFKKKVEELKNQVSRSLPSE